MDDVLKLRKEYMKDIVTFDEDDILKKLEYLHCKKDDICNEVNQMITSLEKQIINEIHQRMKQVISHLKNKVHDHKNHFMWILTEYTTQIHAIKQNLQYRVRPESLEYIQNGLIEACKELWEELEEKHTCIDQDK